MRDFSDSDDDVPDETDQERHSELLLRSDISDGWGTDDASIHEAGGNSEPTWQPEATGESQEALALDQASTEHSTSSNGSIFETRSPRYDGKTDYFFNESGQMSDPHGHVVEGLASTPEQTTYDYVRDVHGSEYIDRRDDS